MKRWTDRGFYWFFGTLFALGVLLLVLPFAYDGWLSQRNQQAVTTYEHRAATADPLIAKLKAYNQMIVAQQQGRTPTTRVAIRQIQPELREPLGYISAPAIKLQNTLIYYGDSDWALAHGAGTMPGTSLPSGGQDTLGVITGHSGLANRIVFDNIRYLQTGDVFYVTSFGTTKAYRVYARKVVDPTDPTTLKAVHVQPGRDRMVLLTCTPLFVNTDRLLVYSKRVSMRAAKATRTVRRDLWRLDHVWLMVVFGLMVGLGAWFLWQQRRRRQNG
ncbi:sortase [Lacticaseibacillus absianus]|uniref:sortase n=1 Tax=Lacticaseibacillus absianus TaxID=2729623 RepID=UPI0015CAE4E7|nr:sortase [Lacticaseibacillus absianus]